MALLSMRADRFWKKTGKMITIQGSDVAGFDKSKVECFNCHKMGHFARECRAPRSQDGGKRESFKQGPKVKEPAPKALMAIDGIGWDWSYMANEEENYALVADDEVPTEFALMAKSSSSSDSEVYNDSYCSKSCRKNTKNLNTKISKLNEELSDCETDLYNYKRGLSEVEARLVEFKENEVKFCERIRVLERDVEIRDNKIEYLNNELEQVKREKESLDNKLTGFENASKDLDNHLGSQRSDNNKEGLPEFVNDTVTDYRRPTPSIDASKCNKSKLQNSNFSIFEHGESTCSIMSKPMIKFVKENDCPRVIKINNTKNTRKSTVKYAEMYKNISKDNGETWPKDNYTHERFLRPFGYHVMILNTLDHLGKFDAKWDEGYFVGYSLSSKAFRVFNKRAKEVEENLHVDFLENKLIEKGAGPNWLFDIDTLTNLMNYVPVFHEAHMETSNDTIRNSDAQNDSQKEQDCNANVPESNGISNPTATSKVPSDDQVEPAVSLTVESKILTVSLPVPTVCLDISPESLSGPRLISKKEEPKKIFDALKDPSWVEAMQEELLQFKIQNVWVMVDCPKGVRPIGIKWVLKNKKDERAIVIRNKARLVAQGYTQEEGIDYKEVFALVVRIKAIRIFLVDASFMGFIVYQMDVKSAFLYGTIDEEVYVMQPLGFKDPEFLERVCKVEKAMYGLHQAPRAWYDVRSANTPMDKENPWGKDGPGKDVELHLYRSMIGSLMYLTASSLDIIFAVCASARHQVTPKECHLHAVKRIFRYLKGHPKLRLWYPKESPFDLVAYSDSDYGGATQDRKSTTGGCQFLRRRLISWKCKKQTIVTTSTTEAEYVAAASGCGQVLWIQNQMLDYGLSKSREDLYEEITSFVLMLIKTMDQETKIIAIVYGKPQTISESSLRRHLKLNDKEGISSLPDDEIFENLSLMGYNILPNQCNIATAVVCLATNRVYNFSKMIFDAPTETLTLRRLTKRAAQIAQSKALSPVVDDHASLSRDDRHGEAFPTVSSLDAGQDRENIAKTSAMSHESSPRVPSLDVDEGSIQQRLHKLMELCTSLQRKQSQMADKIKDQDIEISGLKARVKSLEDTERRPTNILSSGGAAFSTASVSPADVFPTAGVPTVSGSFPTVSVIFTTASVVTPYTRRSKVITIGSLQPMRIPIISAKDKGKEKVTKTEVPKKKKLREQIDAQSKPSSKKEQREFYMSVLKSHVGWKTEHFRGITLEQIKEKFIPVWKHMQDFVPMSSKEEIEKEIHTEGKREYWKIIRLGGHTRAYQFFVDMLKQFDREDLHQLWILVKEIFNIKKCTRDKEKELWVELKRLFEPDFEDQLWTYHQEFMHDPLDWKLYDTCGVHHVSTKNQEIFMLVEKDYPLRKGLATVMIVNKLQVEQYSQMASDLLLKIYNIANSPK
uniref:CCHC-type domain-containing protein n=1 Tax=Tanacetum cinerariifolium TaxID=118510 RepID=A0A6L2MCH9_TANCI|nr:hypothetical protein [Tanacetum cinerariifolium]